MFNKNGQHIIFEVREYEPYTEDSDILCDIRVFETQTEAAGYYNFRLTQLSNDHSLAIVQVSTKKLVESKGYLQKKEE